MLRICAAPAFRRTADCGILCMEVAAVKLIAPEGYDSFTCIADRCQHTCCAGWEIDVDEDALAAYRQVQGPLGKKLAQEIVQAEDGTFSFRLTAEERCPFLRQDHLCELICELGPERLCQVCADHPRYRNFYTDRVEIGLGLCCEEATRQQLTREAPFRLVVLADDGGGEALSPEEAALLRDREALLNIARDRTRPLNARVRELMQLAGMEAAPDMRAWASFFLKLERLDPAWTALLEELVQTPCAPLLPESLSLPGEQLLCCLLYRHLPAALEDGCIQPRLVFVLRCWLLIAALTNAHRAASLPAFLSLVRLFSSEIEYSQENIEEVTWRAPGERLLL